MAMSFQTHTDPKPKERAAVRLPRPRLFILGAGFSHLAGLPLTNELLQRMKELVRKRLPKSVGVFDRAVKMFFPEHQSRTST